MIRRVIIKNFKGFKEHVFNLADSVVLAGPNNAGKTTLLQAIATWKFALDRWLVQREGGRAVARSGVAIPRADITAVPLREMNLLWNDRRVTGPQKMSGARRLIEITVEGQKNDRPWSCGIELQYTNRELMYARPINAKDLDSEALRDFPPAEARETNIVHVPPLSGIERDEPRRDRGMQDLLIGQGRPGEILRNLLLEIAEDKNEDSWDTVARHIQIFSGWIYRNLHIHLCSLISSVNTRNPVIQDRSTFPMQEVARFKYFCCWHSSLQDQRRLFSWTNRMLTNT